MPLPNPTLTWVMTPLQALGAATPAGFITAVEAAINALPAGARQWTAISPTGDVAALPATVLVPPATSPVLAQMRMIVGVSDGLEPAAVEILDDNAPVANLPQVSIGGVYAAGNNWYDPSPYGAGIRNSEFGPWCASVATVTHVFACASEETIFIGARVADATWYGFLGGAILEPPDLGSAEASERIFGFFASGATAANRLSPGVADLITGVNTTDFGRNGGGVNEAKAVVFNPPVPATILRPWMDRRDSESASAAGFGTTIGGNPFFRAIYVRDSAAPTRPLGRLRAVYFYDRALMRGIVQDAALVDRGFLLGQSTAALSECLVLGNAV